MTTLSKARTLAMAWWMTRAGTSNFPVGRNRNRRFNRWYYKIEKRMKGKRESAKLDQESEALFKQMKAEFKSMQPRI